MTQGRDIRPRWRIIDHGECEKAQCTGDMFVLYFAVNFRWKIVDTSSARSTVEKTAHHTRALCEEKGSPIAVELDTEAVKAASSIENSAQQWKPYVNILDRPIKSPTPWWNTQPRQLALCHLEITWEPTTAKSFLARMPDWPYSNILCLTEAAFRPKSYRILMERGNFMPEGQIRQTDLSRCGLRMVFDEPPLPTKEEMCSERIEVDWFASLLSRMTTFLAETLPEEAQYTKAMNDDCVPGLRTKSTYIRNGRFVDSPAYSFKNRQMSCVVS